MHPIISFANVSHFYSNQAAIKNLSFNIAKNKSTAIVGNNGSGKTTIIDIICNLFPYSQGVVTIDGQKIEPKFHSYKRDMGILLSQPYYINEFDIISYWRFTAKFQHVDSDIIHTRIDDLLHALDLEAEISKKIDALSSGNKMKVSVGAMLIHNPEILIMDEPFVNLDVNTTALLNNLFARLNNKKSILITSHQIELVADICDNFIILENGSIKEELNKNQMDSLSIQQSIRSALAKEKKISLDWLLN